MEPILRIRTLGMFAAPLLVVAPASAAPQLVSPVSQDREIACETEVFEGTLQTDAEMDGATDFAPFSSTVDVLIVGTHMVGSAGAEQDSIIGTDSLGAVGTMFATSQHIGGGGLVYADSHATNRCEVVFDLTAQASYELVGALNAYDSSYGFVDLHSVGGETVWSYDTLGGSEEGERTGVLPPGPYRLNINLVGSTTGNAASDYASGDFDFELTFAPFDTGVASCFGVGCPCGNDDPSAGCANSTGGGGRLDAYGSTSVQSDDFVLAATDLPPGNPGIFYMGSTAIQAPFYDGFRCAGGLVKRFPSSVQNSGPSGTMDFGPGIAAQSSGLIAPGTTWHFQGWHRDSGGSPCATGVNLTNLFSVSFTP